MNTYRTPFRRAAGIVGCSLASLPVLTMVTAAPAHATGVLAGTLIENTATATYTSGTGTGSVTSNKVVVKVDELLNVAVATLSTVPATGTGSNPAVLIYSVTNSGNGPEAFNLGTDPAVSGNAFNGTINSVVIDSNANGVYDAGVDTVVSAGAATPLLAPDQTTRVFVLVSLPAGATDAQTSQVRLTASAATGTGSPGTSFSGQGEGGGDAVVGLTTASANSLAALIASLGNVTLTKSATILDPFGTAKPVPGAVVTYSIAANVTGSGAVDSLHVVDVIPAGTTYVPGSLKLDTAAMTDAADTDAGTGGAGGIDVTLGTVSGGTSHTVVFAVKIN